MAITWLLQPAVIHFNYIERRSMQLPAQQAAMVWPLIHDKVGEGTLHFSLSDDLSLIVQDPYSSFFFYFY